MNNYFLLIGGAVIGALIVYTMLKQQVDEAKVLLEKLLRILEYHDK